jgi:glucan phosphoethanolaminetransferase (alkaline phosphatase superfamily)
MKKLIIPAVALAYMAALAASLLMAIKPGAAIFHLITTLRPENFTSDADSSYRYRVNLPPFLFPPEEALVFEGGQQLSRAIEGSGAEAGSSVFETIEASGWGYYLYLYPTENTDPTSNGTTYRLYSALSIVSHSLGVLYFSILLFGVFRFIGYVISAKNYKSLLSLNGWTKVSTGFLTRLRSTLQYIFTQSQSPWRSRLAEGGRLLAITAASAYALILIEWIFHVTKVSFMDSMSFGQKATIFFISGLALASLAMAINTALLLFGLLLRPIRLTWLTTCLNTAIPAALLTSLVVLWLDSFTYTVFRFGILTSTGLLRIAYGVLVLLLFFELYRWLLRLQGVSSQARLTPSAFKLLCGAFLGLLIVSAAAAVSQISSPSEEISPGESYISSGKELPDIILIGGDGVNANHMSLYGYTRETTPVIDALGDVSLVAENAYTNTSKTYGSIISMLTGKYPTRTRVFSPPDILHGIDSYQHLPGILKDLGYSTAQIGVDTYVDANTWNIQNAFDWINQRTVKKNVLVKTLRQLGYELPAYLILTIEERLANRLLQALYVDTIENPFSVVSDAPDWREDRRRIDDLINLLDGTVEPLFVHVHLVETHGPTFEPAIRNYSAGKEQVAGSMIDYYDDSILSYDAYIGALVEELKTSGRFDQTIIILYSDHAQGFQTDERIPLLIHFPADQYKGRIQTNVQNLDIAPTILDFLDIPIPDWMEGDSILQFSTQVREPLFAVIPDVDEGESTEANSRLINSNRLGTENYQFSFIQVFYCQRMYQLNLYSFEWSIVDIAQHTAPCDENSLLEIPQARQAVLQFFTNQGYDTSIIP